MANLFGAPMQNPVLAQQAQDPRQLLAQSLIAGGANARPVNSPIEGIARLGSALAGALISRNVGQEYKQRGENYNQTLAQALQASQPWKAPDNIMNEAGTDVVVPKGQNAPGTGGMEALAAALRGNPDTAPMAMQMQFDQFGRQNALQDALALERGKSEFAPPIVLPEGGTAVNRAGSVVVQGGPRQTDRQREAVGMGLQAGTPEYNDFIRTSRQPASSSTSVSVKTPAQMGTIPPGFRVEYDGQSNPVAMVPIPGSPAAREETAAANATAANTQQRQTTADVVVSDIDRVLGIVKDANVPVTGFGALFKAVPASDAKNVAALLDTIKANAGFDKLGAMRAASPTGGALGNVTERELSLLQSTIGSLEQEQSQEQFVRNLQRVKEVYLDTIHGKGNRPDVPGGSAPPALNANPYADKSDDDILKDLRARGLLK